jgi:hypothetical protein
MARGNPAHLERGPDPLPTDALALDDEDLTRQLRAWGRSLAGKNEQHAERNARRLLRLCVLAGIDQVRSQISATTKRYASPTHQEDA